MDRTSVCDFCLKFWTVDTKEWEVLMGGFERDMTEMENSAAAGCHCCAIFIANTELLQPHLKNMQLLPKDHNRIFIVFAEHYLSLCEFYFSLGNTPLKHVMQIKESLEPKLSDVRHEPYTGAKSSFDQAREWMRICRESHPGCRSKPDYQPTRLLYIDAETQTVRLRHKDELPTDVQYATLSHCWGQRIPHCLKKDSVSTFERGLTFTELAKTFREAVTVCQELSMDYVWIDCFCIIQDCAEDWNVEALQMRQVYGNSSLNIAATNSHDSNGGLFRKRHVKSLRPFKISVKDFGHEEDEEESFQKTIKELEDDPEVPDLEFYLTDIDLCWDRFERAPLNRRSWVLQERLLSPRVLHFDKDQLVWECDAVTACDRFPGPEGIAGLVPEKKRIRASIDKLQCMKDLERPLGQELHDIWKPIIKSYTAAGLTRPTDRLVALDGIARRLSDIYDCSYVAGLFTKSMESQLAWRLERGEEPRFPDIERAPTWSWARFPRVVDMLPQWQSVDCDQVSRRLKNEDLCETHLCRITNKDHLASTWSPLGDFEDLALDVSCFLAQVRLIDFSEVKAWQNKECELIAWPEEDADAGKGASRSTNSLPFQEERPLEDIWPLYENGGGFGLWVGASGAPLVVQSLTEIQEDSIVVDVDLDVWTDYRKRRTLHLMPAYEVTGYEPQDIWEKHNVRSIHGLILERLGSTENRFRRIGVFSIAPEQRQAFWRAAIHTDVPGLPKHLMRVDTWPDLDCEVSGDEAFKCGVEDNAPQYRISIV